MQKLKVKIEMISLMMIFMGKGANFVILKFLSVFNLAYNVINFVSVFAHVAFKNSVNKDCLFISQTLRPK